MANYLKETLITAMVNASCCLVPGLHRHISDTPPGTEHIVAALTQLGQEATPSPETLARIKEKVIREADTKRH
jgi:hypothetical protein